MSLFDIGMLLAQTQDAAAESSSWDQLLAFGKALLIYIVPVVVAIFLGGFIARRLRMEAHGWRISVVLAFMVSAVVIVSTLWPPKFGVDLRGGVNIIGVLDDVEYSEGEKVQAKDIVETLRKRIDPGSVKEIVIRNRGTDQIEVIIPDVNQAEAERIWKTLAKAGHLEFRIVADEQVDEHERALARARETTGLRTRIVRTDASEEHPQGEILGRWTPLSRIDKESDFARQSKGYLYFKFTPLATHLIRNGDTGTIIRPPIAVLNANSEIAFTKWCDTQGVDNVEVLVVQPDEKENVEGEHLSQVRSGFDSNANPAVHFGTNAEGSKRMGRLTMHNIPVNGKKRLLGIVLDGKLDSAPSINSVITNQGIIQGRFSEQEVSELVNILKSGKLDVALKDQWISFDQIESSLGEELKQKGFLAIGISLSLVLVFMIFYYRFSGIVACIALVLNLLFILSMVLLVKQALTLAGLAGLVLTVGMSVDANVLIFERIREELARGAALRMAIRNGFDRATTTIVDANVTTLITAVILYLIGTEQVKSFAVTLILGILLGMFTAIFCSRIIFEIAERKKWITQLNMARILSKANFDFLGKRGFTTVLSLIVICVGLIGVFVRGPGVLDKDLRGGSTSRIVLNQDSTASEVATLLNQSSYTFPPKNEKVEFEVTALTDNAKGFIVDSNLPVLSEEEWKELDSEAKLLTLDAILSNEFSGKLAMLGVNYDPKLVVTKMTAGTPNENLQNPNEANEEDKAADPSKKDGAGILPNRQRSTAGVARLSKEQMNLAAISFLQPFSMLVDPNVFEIQDSKTQEGGTQEVETQEGNGASNTEENPGNTQQEPPANTNPAESNPTQDTGPEFETFERVEVETTLNFDYALNDSSVKGGLIDAANSLGDVRLEEMDIDVVNTINQLGGDKILHGKEWKVKVRVAKEEDAKRVFDAMKSKIDSSPFIPSTSGVGGQIAGQARLQALIALIASLLGIVAYVWIRFQNIAFGLAAVVALIHDVLVVLGAIAISHWLTGIPMIDNFKISLPVIAGFLTIIGYSLNDTIVVFDRIREVRGKRTDMNVEIINKSISQTLSRTILTSITTFIVVFILFVLGGASIHAFAFSLVIGVIVGTYSSIFVASPVLLLLMNWGKPGTGKKPPIAEKQIA